MIHRDVVVDLNRVIQRKGSKKVGMLTAIKNFKKGIYVRQWENEGYDMKVRRLCILNGAQLISLVLFHCYPDLKDTIILGNLRVGWNRPESGFLTWSHEC